MKTKNIAFLSHIDKNLYLFRRPIMLELLKQGYRVYAVVPKGEYFDALKRDGITPIAYNIERKSLNPLRALMSIWSIYRAIKPLDLDLLSTFMLKPNIYGALVILMWRFITLKRADKTLSSDEPYAEYHEKELASLSAINNRKILLVCAITGLGSFYIEKSLKARCIKWLTQKLYKLSFGIAQKVIFQNSDDLHYFVQQKIVAPKKAVLIRSSGVDTTFFSPENVDEDSLNNLKKELTILPNERVILMVSRLVIHKGVGVYIEAVKRLKKNLPQNSPNVRFLLVGDFDEGNPFCIDRALLDTTGLEWLGERSDIKDLIALSDLFVLPSFREGVPRTLLEAGAMGKPIITCDSVGCREVARHNHNGLLVKPQDANALSEAMATLISDDGLRERLSQNARRYIQDNFEVSIVTKAYISLYEELLQ